MDSLNKCRHLWPKGLVILAILGLVSSIGCGQGTSQAGQAKADRPAQKVAAKPAPIAVTQVAKGDAVSRYTTTAALEAEHHAEILARSTGVVREILHEEGDRVEANQLLLRLENDDQLLGLKQAEIKLKQIEHEFNRQVKMKDLGILAEQEFEDIRNQLETAQAEKEVAELNLSYTEVRAPFSGYIVRRLVDRGANIQPGNPLFEIMDTDPLLVRAHVPANRLGQISTGQKVQVYLDSSDILLDGTISLVSPIVDPESGTIKITTEITDYPAAIRPGDFAEVRILTARRENALLVPSIAVFEEQGKHILYVVREGKAVRREVEVGFADDGMTEIRRGVEAGELVVSKGQRNLRDGVPVEILEGPTSVQGANEKQALAQAAS